LSKKNSIIPLAEPTADKKAFKIYFADSSSQGLNKNIFTRLLVD
jgi:hypothetical protein